MLALTLCVSTLAASEVAQSAALRTRRHLLGIHHTTKYAPETAARPTEGQEGEDQTENDQTKAKEAEEEAKTKAKEAEEEAKTKTKETAQNDSADESHDSHDSIESIESGPVDMELKENEELELESTKDIDLELKNGPVDMDVDLEANEGLDYDGEGDQEIDLTSVESLDFSASAKLEGEEQMDTEIELEDGAVSLELEDDEDYNQDLDINDDEELDQVIDVPEGAKSIRLRVRKGHVDLDITKATTADVKEPKTETKKEEQAAAPEKTEEQAAAPEKTEEQAAAPEKTEEQAAAPENNQDKTEVVAAASTEKAVSYAAEAKDWFQENGSKPIFLGGMIGAAVGLVGVAGVAIAKGRKRAPEKSVLAEDAIADAEAEADEDEDDAAESDSDEDSDEDVEAGVTALTKEDVADGEDNAVVEEKKTSVVEGSV